MKRVRRVGHGRLLLAAVAAAAAAVALTGCDPDESGLGPASVAFTTDKLSTRALERGGLSVRWLTCTGDPKEERVAGSSASRSPDVSIDCRGRTDDDRKIRITGVVRYAEESRCVRGELTAAVDGHRVFRTRAIGKCDSGGGRSAR
ncbi:hypothetical protein RKE29_03160 [Streptomyces sp. B1866]|uniref:hypothetical protein n=1 Tax=Streptomyces sp. B1866 TaxID=3075431 RepID=UPI00288E480E|nr:hypothetical protein [Streptomyces sp. B1866]MDT3395657.1 hypothetical protein [Streptomyces sp. B1866]